MRLESIIQAISQCVLFFADMFMLASSTSLLCPMGALSRRSKRPPKWRVRILVVVLFLRVLCLNALLLLLLFLGHELRGCMCYYNCAVAGLAVPLMCLVDYRGFRLIAITVLPIGRNTLVRAKLTAISLIFLLVAI
jgi:hypothetical protein